MGTFKTYGTLSTGLPRMEANVYGLLGVVVVWIGTIVTVYLKTRNGKRNGNKLTQTSSELSIVLGHAMDLEKAVAELKKQHQGEIDASERNREQWQLRALSCEERERSRSE
jgi:hypothetical protein